MPFDDHNPAPGRPVVSLWRRPALLLALLCAAPAAHALDGGDIVITTLKGEVHVTMNGAERSVRAGAVLELPATVRTGRDGAIDLRQGTTSVSVGPDTQLDFPATDTAGGPIDRIQQPRGNVFYDVGKRGARKLRIETPFLVAVVKGTQFNVAARDDATTIALFEGQLEIRSSDGSDVVDLVAGQIASRQRDEPDIGVIGMNAPKPAPATPSGADAGDRGIAPPAAQQPEPVADDAQILADDLSAAPDSQPDFAATEAASLVALALPEVSQGLVDIPSLTDGGLDPGSAGADAGAGAGAGAGDPGAVDAGKDLDVGGAVVDAGAGGSVDPGGGAGNVDAGAGVNAGGVDVGVDVDLDPDLDGDDGNAGHGNSNGNDSDNPGRGKKADQGLLGDITEDVVNLLDSLRKPGKK